MSNKNETTQKLQLSKCSEGCLLIHRQENMIGGIQELPGIREKRVEKLLEKG